MSRGTLLLLLLLYAGCADRPTESISMSESILYWSNQASDAYPLELTLHATGEAVLRKPANSDDRTLGVGIYEGRISENDFAQLWKQVTGADMAALAEPSDVEPGEQIRRFEYASGTAPAVTVAVAESFPPNGAFLQAEKTVQAIVKSLLDSPVVAVGGTIRSVRSAGGSVTATVDIANRGTSEFLLIEPAKWDERGVQFLLEFQRNDVPEEELGSQHQEFVTVSGSDVTLSRPAVTDLRVAAGDSVTFEIELQHAIPSGSYDAHVYYESPLLSADGAELMIFDMELGPVTPGR